MIVTACGVRCCREENAELAHVSAGSREVLVTCCYSCFSVPAEYSIDVRRGIPRLRPDRHLVVQIKFVITPRDVTTVLSIDTRPSTTAIAASCRKAHCTHFPSRHEIHAGLATARIGRDRFGDRLLAGGDSVLRGG